MWEIIRKFIIQTDVEHIKCPHCGARFLRVDKEEWGYCPECGKEVSNV